MATGRDEMAWVGLGWNKQEWDGIGSSGMQQPGIGWNRPGHGRNGIEQVWMGWHGQEWDAAGGGGGWQERSKVRHSGSAGPRRVPAVSPGPSLGRARGPWGRGLPWPRPSPPSPPHGARAAPPRPSGALPAEAGGFFPFRARAPGGAAGRARAMAELAQGQSQSAAPVGIKPEGFVDALHRARQVSCRPAGRRRAGGGRGAPLGRGAEAGQGHGPAAPLPGERSSGAVPWGAAGF